MIICKDHYTCGGLIKLALRIVHLMQYPIAGSFMVYCYGKIKVWTEEWRLKEKPETFLGAEEQGLAELSYDFAAMSVMIPLGFVFHKIIEWDGKILENFLSVIATAPIQNIPIIENEKALELFSKYQDPIIKDNDVNSMALDV